MIKRIIAAIVVVATLTLLLCGCDDPVLKKATPMTKSEFADALASLGYTEENGEIFDDRDVFVWRDGNRAYSFYKYESKITALVEFNNLTASFEAMCIEHSSANVDNNKRWEGYNETMCYKFFRLSDVVIYGQDYIENKDELYSNVTSIVRGK